MDAKITTSSRYIDVALITNLPANCINRDDSGRPKITPFGGFERQSPSAQFLKRGWRRASVNGNVVYRSQYAPVKLAELLGLNPTPALLTNLAEAIYEDSVKKPESVEGRTAGLILLGDDETVAIANALRPFAAELQVEHEAKERDALMKNVRATLAKDKDTRILGNATEAAIIALYGRMVTSSEINEAPDAALQVCRAMSTTSVVRMVDYFSAVDEMRLRGAGHIGTRQFVGGSNLLLECRVNLDLLCANAQFGPNPSAEQIRVVRGVVSDLFTTILSTPLAGAANQGSFSTSPRTYGAVVRYSKRTMPCDLMPAYLTPSDPKTTMAEDARRLFDYADLSERVFAASSGGVDATLKFEADGGTKLVDFTAQVDEMIAAALPLPDAFADMGL